MRGERLEEAEAERTGMIRSLAVFAAMLFVVLYLVIGAVNVWMFSQTPRVLTDSVLSMWLLWPTYWDWAWVLHIRR